MTISTSAGPGNAGLYLETHDARMTSTNAVTKGDVVSVTTTTIDSDTGVMDTVGQPVTADLDFGIFAVALEDVAAGEVGWFRFKGKVDAFITGTPAAGAAVAANNGADQLGVTSATEKVIGYMLELGTNGGIHPVMFDGIAGFGADEA